MPFTGILVAYLLKVDGTASLAGVQEIIKNAQPVISIKLKRCFLIIPKLILIPGKPVNCYGFGMSL
jgi:hypothetical protein